MLFPDQTNLSIIEKSIKASIKHLKSAFKIAPLCSEIALGLGLRKLLFYLFATQEECEVLGWYSHTGSPGGGGSLCRVVVHRAGHQTPRDAPRAARAMMRAFVARGCLP